MYLVFWGPNWQSDTSGVTAAEQSLFSHIGGSAFNGVLTQYYDARYMVHNDEALLASWIDTSTPPSSVVSQPLVNEANRARTLNGWQNSLDTQYIIFPQSGATLPSNDCAYHVYATSNGNGSNDSYVASAVGYLADASFGNCLSFYGGTLVRSATTTASHEYAESATDPIPLSGWVDRNGKEIGDECAGLQGPGPGSQYVTELWDNLSGSCQTSVAPLYNWGSWWNSSYPNSISTAHDYPAGIELVNKGNIAWEVGTQGVDNPLNRGSCFAGDGWLSNNHIALAQNISNGANPTGPVLPGQIAFFSWNWMAPPSLSCPNQGAQPGTYTEYFATEVVEPNYQVFGARNTIFWRINVGSYADCVGSQLGPPPAALLGDTYSVQMTFTNCGTATWYHADYSGREIEMGTANPQDRATIFNDSSWVSSTRPVDLTTDAGPNQSATFNWNMHVPCNAAPSYPATFNESFAPMAAWVTIMTANTFTFTLTGAKDPTQCP